MSETFNAKLDGERLGKQLGRVRTWMLMWGATGSWFTLQEISRAIFFPEASISARLRDLRRMGYQVDKRRRGNPKAGLFEYQVRKPAPKEAQPSLFEVHA